jgi:hypothetical protein
LNEKNNNDYPGIDTEDKLPKDPEYRCELCMEKFDKPNDLQEHRAAIHNAAKGI